MDNEQSTTELLCGTPETNIILFYTSIKNQVNKVEKSIGEKEFWKSQDNGNQYNSKF